MKKPNQPAIHFTTGFVLQIIGMEKTLKEALISPHLDDLNRVDLADLIKANGKQCLIKDLPYFKDPV